ncbi:hypothetical protein GALMADRAFT_265965 [Galerina marginata CBS 339.88]|uniref:Uncharacterized protein n=1 Tax=Galerina marginata (strain CBS 339.88) TaxID=685588 RepID=A0A067T8S5_GALM3|nr:hypothetical protein GALMADRAFT_265965 [Galerina marginata CBS 339.88]
MGNFGREASAALVFLVLYVAIFSWMLWAYLTKRIKLASRYSILFFHVTIRVASQACGLVFGVQGWANPDVLLAFLILGAEGYFSLVICAFRFLISWHQHNLPSHESWLEPRQVDHTPNARRKRVLKLIMLGPFAIFFYWKQPMVVFHSVLVIANAAIIFGGSYLSGADFDHPETGDLQRRLNIAKITRTTGQSVFLACNFLLLFAILATIRERKRTGLRKIHPTLVLLTIAWFPLMIRGIFGILQSAVWSLSYYNRDNYDETGFTSSFVTFEYALGVMTEWLACLLLILTYFTSSGDPSKGEIVRMEQKVQDDESAHFLR